MFKNLSKMIFLTLLLGVVNVQAESLIIDGSCVPENLAMDSNQILEPVLVMQDPSGGDNSDGRFGEAFSGWNIQPASASLARTMTANQCENLKGFKSGFDYVSMSLLPVTVALRSPAFALQFAELGLTLANPAVLGVTVLGATGYVVIYFILKKSMDECEALEKEELRTSIINELSSRYKMRSSGRVDLKIQN